MAVSQASASSSVASGMSWQGIVPADKIQLLCQEFGDVIISPGFAGPFGKEADNWGRVYIPGATHGFAQARRQLLGWKDKIEHDPRYKWWPEKMRELDITPITVANVLNGLQADPWRSYRNRYRNVRKFQSTVRTKHRRREEARTLNSHKLPEEAASVLSGLQAEGSSVRRRRREQST